jgi:3D-(3,5/4)-trihydroxycyclohexane-1,2-dione acylhydrolase (decyclizing)
MNPAPVRLTVGQAVVRFLASQYSERDGVERRLIPGCFGIFGHGNVAGIGQALLQAQLTGDADLPYHLARNEQAMVHAATGFARMRNRLQALACTPSIGPGSTNMLTGAALATINRIPVLLLPSDLFATRVASPVLQELEDARSGDVSVNDAFRPLSRYFDRIYRPEQLPSALMSAMRVLTDPADTGAVTLALPQDVQAKACRGTWSSRRPGACPATCRCCGGPATRSSTTSNTATRAWATRSPARSGSRWPRRTGRSSPWSGTART